MTYEIKYTLTPEIIKAGVKLFWLSNFIWLRALLPSILLLGLFSIGFALHLEIPHKIFFYGGVYLLLLWATSIAMYFLISHKKMKSYEELEEKELTLTFDNKGISLLRPQGGSKYYLWKQLRATRTSKDVLLLLWGGLHFSTIPINQSTATLLALIADQQNARIPPPILSDKKSIIDRNNKNGWWVVFAFFVGGLIGLALIVLMIAKMFFWNS